MLRVEENEKYRQIQQEEQLDQSDHEPCTCPSKVFLSASAGWQTSATTGREPAGTVRWFTRSSDKYMTTAQNHNK